MLHLINQKYHQMSNKFIVKTKLCNNKHKNKQVMIKQHKNKMNQLHHKQILFKKLTDRICNKKLIKVFNIFIKIHFRIHLTETKMHLKRKI